MQANQPDKNNISQNILEMVNITKKFPGVVALNAVDFMVQAGEVHALVGENGAGKSTLMKILSGAYQPDTGKIILRGKEVFFNHPLQPQRVGISVIYQELNLLPIRSVAQNIFLGREITHWGLVKHRKMENQTSELLRRIGVDIPPKTKIRDLSVAQQQQVEIVKALSLDAEILVMDEPTAALAPQEVENLFKLIQRLQAQGVTIIYISHRLDELFQIADRVTVLKDGARVTTCKINEITHDELVHLMVGRELDIYFPPKAKDEEIGNVVLDVDNIRLTEESTSTISFNIRQGEIVGFSGLEGSGRTKLARAIFGAEKIYSGEVRLDGQKTTFHNPQDAIKGGLGFITEDRKQEGLILIQSLRNNIALPSLGERQKFGLINEVEESIVVSESSLSLDLRASSDLQEVQFLSGGNQQKAVLAKWLVTEARVIIFDEPTRGIDVGAKAGIHQLMRKMASSGKAIMMISSELPEIVGMSDRVLVMNKGDIFAEYSGEGLNEAIILQAIGKAGEANNINGREASYERN